MSKFLYLFCFILGPFYVLSRVINVLFAIIIVFYVYVNNYWNKIDLFQWSMMIIYASFTLIVLILLGLVLFDQFYLFHIIPCEWNLPCLGSSVRKKRQRREKRIRGMQTWHTIGIKVKCTCAIKFIILICMLFLF